MYPTILIYSNTNARHRDRYPWADTKVLVTFRQDDGRWHTVYFRGDDWGKQRTWVEACQSVMNKGTKI